MVGTSWHILYSNKNWILTCTRRKHGNAALQNKKSQIISKAVIVDSSSSRSIVVVVVVVLVVVIASYVVHTLSLVLWY